jgi:DtxR family Mn-dependent transcriptional regulator
MPWDRVHQEAEVLEHAISPELSALIAEKLGNPTHDPHGDPIPTPTGEIEQRATVALSDLQPGAKGMFVRVSDSDPEMLRYLSDRGIAPGEQLEVLERHPFDGPLIVRFDSGDHALGGGLVRMMRVRQTSID